MKNLGSGKLYYNVENKFNNKIYALSCQPRVELHKVLTYGPSLPNRDENNNVKMVNGRAYISSQCIKSAWRRALNNRLEKSNTIRTIYFLDVIDEWIDLLNVSDEVKKELEDLSISLLVGLEGDKNKVEISNDGRRKLKTANQYTVYQFEAFIDWIKEDNIIEELEAETKSKEFEMKKKKFKAVLANLKLTEELALYGTFSADLGVRIDGGISVNMAYSITEHRNQKDFFTAEDTFSRMFPYKNVGSSACHMNTKDVLSNSLYVYSSFDIGIILRNFCLGVDISVKENQEIIKKMTANEFEAYFWDYLTVHPEANKRSMPSFPDPHFVLAVLGNSQQPRTYDGIYMGETIKKDENTVVHKVALEKLVNDLINDNCTIRLKTYNKRSLIMKKYKGEFSLSDEEIAELNNKDIDVESYYEPFIESVKEMIMGIEFIEA